MLPMQVGSRQKWLKTWSDDLSCALFGLANVVTVMYYAIDAAGGRDSLVEGGNIARPAWLGFSVHVFNAMVAWADILTASPRTFSKRAEWLSMGTALVYNVWIVLCSYMNGAFPYPFLNDLPQPQGFLGVSGVSIVLFFVLFRCGKFLAGQLSTKYKHD